MGRRGACPVAAPPSMSNRANSPSKQIDLTRRCPFFLFLGLGFRWAERGREAVDYVSLVRVNRIVIRALLWTLLVFLGAAFLIKLEVAICLVGRVRVWVGSGIGSYSIGSF
jgi:hypothetical protein